MGEDEEMGEDEYDEEESEERAPLLITDKKAAKLRSKTPQPQGTQSRRDERGNEVDSDYLSDTPSESSGTPNPSELDSSDLDSDEGQDMNEN